MHRERLTELADDIEGMEWARTTRGGTRFERAGFNMLAWITRPEHGDGVVVSIGGAAALKWGREGIGDEIPSRQHEAARAALELSDAQYFALYGGVGLTTTGEFMRPDQAALACRRLAAMDPAAAAARCGSDIGREIWSQA